MLTFRTVSVMGTRLRAGWGLGAVVVASAMEGLLYWLHAGDS